MADYYDKCGSCKFINWNSCFWSKYDCIKRSGTSVYANEKIDGCKYYEFNGMSNSEIERKHEQSLK